MRQVTVDDLLVHHRVPYAYDSLVNHDQQRWQPTRHRRWRTLGRRFLSVRDRRWYAQGQESGPDPRCVLTIATREGPPPMERPGAYQTETLEDASSAFKTFQSASFTFHADCNPADARWTLSAATPAEFQEPVGPPISLEATSHAWSHTHHRLGLTRPSPSSSAERSPSRGPVSISLRLHVILHRLVVVLAGLADLLDRLTRA